MNKFLDLVAVGVVSFSLITSLVNPTVVNATSENTPVVTTMTSTEALVIPTPAIPEMPVQKTYKVKYTKVVIATAYSSEAAQTDSTPCIPAMWKFDLCENFAKTGIEDTIADNSLKLGTIVQFKELPGQIFVVRDRMNSKYNGKPRIDFWKSSKPAAVTFGVKKFTMEVLDEVKPIEVAISK